MISTNCRVTSSSISYFQVKYGIWLVGLNVAQLGSPLLQLVKFKVLYGQVSCNSWWACIPSIRNKRLASFPGNEASKNLLHIIHLDGSKL